MSPDRSADLEVLIRVAQSVQVSFRKSSGSPHRADVVAMGADGTPTEEVDREAEAQILASLDREGVDWDLLSEEAGLVKLHAKGGRRVEILPRLWESHRYGTACGMYINDLTYLMAIREVRAAAAA